jgi:putative transposase
MARRKRVFIEGLTLHVTQRGNNKCPTFVCDADFESFLWFLRFAMRRYHFLVHSYALMSNHFHLMVTPSSPTALPRGMQSLGRRYVRYFNDRYNRTGTLWEGRYRTALITDERYWLTCLRYVEMNPVRAGLAGPPESYKWCSYRAHALGERDPVIASHAVFDALATSAERRCEAWTTICCPPLHPTELENLRKSVKNGYVSSE